MWIVCIGGRRGFSGGGLRCRPFVAVSTIPAMISRSKPAHRIFIVDVFADCVRHHRLQTSRLTQCLYDIRDAVSCTIFMTNQIGLCLDSATSPLRRFLA